MEGLSGPQAAGTWRFRRLVITAALVVALFAALLLSPIPAPIRLAVTGVGMVGGALAMAAGFRMRAVQASLDRDRPAADRRRRAWGLYAIAAVLAALSNLLLVTFAAAGISNRTPSDTALFLALICAAAGLATFPLARRRTTDLLRMLLDGVILAGSALFVASVTILPQILADADASRAFSIAVPAADVVIATVAALLFFRGAPQDRPLLGLATLGFVCYAASDFAYAADYIQQGSYAFGTWTDLGWIAGYGLFAVAAHSPGTDAVPHGERPLERAPVLGTLVMFGLFLTATALASLRNDRLTATAAWLGVAVLVALMLRQVLLIVDNDRLRRELEQRVQERTRSLRQVSQQSQLLITSVGDGIYGVDTAGLVTFVNPAACEVLGYSSAELIGREAHTTFHAKRSDGRPFPVDTCYVTEAITQHKVTNAEEDTYLRADGLAVPVEVTATPLIDDGRAIGAVVVFRDVTQRREVDRMKTEFVSIVSHELRTPVAAIHGSLGLLAGGAVGALSPSAQRMVDIALVSSDRLRRLINEILDIERIESGMLSMELGTHSCRSLIESAVSQVQILAEEAGVRVSVGSTEGQVYADADRVVQTLLNLLSNAIKFSHPEGHVSVRSAAKGEFVEFAIQDDGRGIPEDKLDQIFTRFQQVDSSDAREKGGTGLGLSISRSIVERLGGRIWARNNAGSGTTFLFTLPAHGPVEETAPQSYRPGAPEASASPSDRFSEPAESRF